jgi:hypothetical protein
MKKSILQLKRESIIVYLLMSIISYVMKNVSIIRLVREVYIIIKDIYIINKEGECKYNDKERND